MRKIMAFIAFLILISGCAMAEDGRVFILCNPSSFVNVHRNPRNTSENAGRLECGESALTDGKTKNGFLHILNVTEYGEGWVFMGYVTEEEPEVRNAWAYVARNRVRARRYIRGERIGWLGTGDEIRVYAHTSEWAVTSKGFVNMDYLELWYE